MEDSVYSLANLPFNHLSPVDVMRKVKGEMVVADRLDRTVHMRFVLDFEVWLEKVRSGGLEIEFELHRPRTGELLDLHRHVVVFPVGVFVDNAHVKQRVIKEA